MEEIQEFCERVKNLKALVMLEEDENVSAGFWEHNISRENITKSKYTLMYVIAGEGEYLDESGSVNLYPGTLLLRTPETVHSVLRNPLKSWLEYYVIIPEVLYLYLRDSGTLPSFKSSTIPLSLNWLNYLEKMTLILQQMSHRNKDRCLLKIHEFYIDLKEQLQLKRKTQAGRDDILTICKMIDRDPSQRISNQDLAEQAGYGLEHFRKLFRDITGCSPQDYMIKSRIEKAQRMILNGEHKIEKIAFDLGYQDLPSFSRQFKKITGSSPSSYKRNVMDL